MNRQVVGNVPLTNPVVDILLSAPLFIYFSVATGGGPLDLSLAVRCYNNQMPVSCQFNGVMPKLAKSNWLFVKGHSLKSGRLKSNNCVVVTKLGTSTLG